MRFRIDENFKIQTELFRLQLQKVEQLGQPSVRGSQGDITILLPANFTFADHQEWLNKAVVAVLRQQCSVIVTPRIRAWCSRIGHPPKRIVYKDVSSRWGSCSSLGNVNFSVWLLMTPQPLLDYVICHELAHLKVPNHSPAFYVEVDRILQAGQGAAKRLDAQLNQFSRNLVKMGRVK